MGVDMLMTRPLFMLTNVSAIMSKSLPVVVIVR
jgi:hypothetical protein